MSINKGIRFLGFLFFSCNLYGSNEDLWTYEQMIADPYTDHVRLFHELFQIEKVHSFLEFGVGRATKYFLDHCGKVVSIELMVENRRAMIEPWFEKSLELFQSYENWQPLCHLFSLHVDQADQIAYMSEDPALLDSTYL